MRDRFSVIWIVLVYALFALAWFSRLKPWKRIVFPFALSALSLVLLLFAIQGRYSRGVGTISVIDVGQGQCIAVMAGDKTLVIDCGGINDARNAGEEAGAYLRSRGRKQVDLLLLTHLHADHCNGVSRLMEMMPVKEILIPADLEDEDNLLDEIETAAKRHGIEIEYLREDSLIFLGPIGLQLFAPSGNGDANERCMCMLVSLGSYDMLHYQRGLQQLRTPDLRDPGTAGRIRLWDLSHRFERNCGSTGGRQLWRRKLRKNSIIPAPCGY